MRFIANLRPETIETFEASGQAPAGYLLSAHRITPAALKDARHVRTLDLPLFADNGSTELIGRVVDQFRERAKTIARQVQDLRHELGRVPRGRDVTATLRAKASQLSEEVVAASVRESDAQSSEALLAAQLSMEPTDIIAREDFATACLLSLDLERETTGWAVPRFVTRNQRSLRLWRQCSDHPDAAGRRVYAVLSATDYNTARAAGGAAARAGARHIAFGAASVTRDLEATDFFVLGNATTTLERPVPRRYVRLAQIVCGLDAGARSVGAPFERVHCLGLGAPSLLPIAGIGFDPTTDVSTDATSPIHDAAKDRVFYDPVTRIGRATTMEIVSTLLEGGDWPFVSPFSIAFR